MAVTVCSIYVLEAGIYTCVYIYVRIPAHPVVWEVSACAVAGVYTCTGVYMYMYIALHYMYNMYM